MPACLRFAAALLVALASAASAQVRLAPAPDDLLTILQRPDAGNVARRTGPVSALAAPSSAWPAPFGRPMLFDGAPLVGSVLQDGRENGLALSASGQGNAVAFSQVGDANRIAGAVAGIGNAAAVVQSGQGNAAAFTQTGRANALLIRQSAW